MTDTRFQVDRIGAKPEPISFQTDSQQIVLYLLLGIIVVADLAGCWTLGLRFTDWKPVLAGSGGMAALGIAYRLSGRSSDIASTAKWTLFWIAFSAGAAILTYVAAAIGTPWRDVQLSAADAIIGFEWTAWFEFVQRHWLLKLSFFFAYNSLLIQILFSVHLFRVQWPKRMQWGSFDQCHIGTSSFSGGIFPGARSRSLDSLSECYRCG